MLSLDLSTSAGEETFTAITGDCHCLPTARSWQDNHFHLGSNVCTRVLIFWCSFPELYTNSQIVTGITPIIMGKRIIDRCLWKAENRLWGFARQGRYNWEFHNMTKFCRNRTAPPARQGSPLFACFSIPLCAFFRQVLGMKWATVSCRPSYR